jgi:cobalt-zinc-cadmium efflux system membrane fusion protein
MTFKSIMQLGMVCVSAAWLAGCTRVHGDAQDGEGMPSRPRVVQESDGAVVTVAHPERFPLATAATYAAPAELTVTGTVNPDVSRAVPVISLASGRVVEIHARLGDQVKNGQLLLRVRSTDVAGAWSDYQHAVADEVLARAQLARANDLFTIGAIAKKDLEVAQDGADKAAVDVRTTSEKLRVVGVSPDQPPNSLVDIVAPVSGIITDQQVTNAAGVQSLGTNPFTISDLSWVWVVCDVYENELARLQLGDTAEIHLAAFPDRVLTGRISNILPMLDPNIRTAKVRIEVRNPGGLLRLGMFVTALFRGQQMQERAVVPASAVVHLHDRDFVYAPTGTAGQFRRIEVVAGPMRSGDQQEIIAGIEPGARVIADGLAFANTVGPQAS